MNNQNGLNLVFPIYYDDTNGNRQPFHNIVLRKATYDNVIMSLGRNITGDFVWIDNKLQFTMKEYVIFEDVKYYIVNPPTVTRNGLVKDNSDTKGATRYSVTFYHPEYMLGAFPFSDIAVEESQEKYLSQNKIFSWIGNLTDYVAKLNANLMETEWICRIDDSVTQEKRKTLSEVLAFDNNFVSDALKTGYETWEVPFVVSMLDVNDEDYANGKRYLIQWGYPSKEITSTISKTIYCGHEAPTSGVYYFEEPIRLFKGDSIVVTPQDQAYEGLILNSNLEYIANSRYTATETTEIYVAIGGDSGNVTYTQDGAYLFRFGKGVGLKNNSTTPKGNKIVTRLSGYGSERNIPYGYPQIPWVGNPDWTDTKNNPNDPDSYPIYKGIVGGQYVQLIKHPFTRTHLMPSIYRERVNKKVNPYADGYNPDIEIIDYYDAPSTYPNPINVSAPSYETHEFEDVYPRLWSDGEKTLVDVQPYDNQNEDEYLTMHEFALRINAAKSVADKAHNLKEIHLLDRIYSAVQNGETMDDITGGGTNPHSAKIEYDSDEKTWAFINHTSSVVNFTYKVLRKSSAPAVIWDDTMDDDGNYLQSYFKITLPPLGFDLYACASITEQMDINMRSGACLGCTFTIQCDWEDYKNVFWDDEGNFDPSGAKRQARIDDYPDSTSQSITVIVAKDIDTFGTLMPNKYQNPKAGDSFVILGISLPLTYINNAEHELDETMMEYILENNVYYFDYPLNFDEKFLRENLNILYQIDNNKIVRFEYGNALLALYVKQISIKFGESVLPQYSITLTDDVEIVMNQLGQTTEDVSKLRVQVSQIAQYYGMDKVEGYASLQKQLDEKISKIADDIAKGHITFQNGITLLGESFFDGVMHSVGYRQGINDGYGWELTPQGNMEIESLKVRSFLEVVELLVNRVQAQEGDTMFTDNDQIDNVETVISDDENTVYRLTFKSKWDGYVTSQVAGNILKGVINTLAAKNGRVSDVGPTDGTQSSDRGGNKYYTSWMYILTDDEIGEIQIDYGQTLPALQTNQVYVRCYISDYVPSLYNFPPCEFMTVTRWGCRDTSSTCSVQIVTTDQSILRTITQRQQSFYLSTSEGRIVKLIGVNNPILRDENYGTTLGILPDFVKNYAVVAQRIQANPNRDYLYAQGVVVEDFIKVDYQGNPIINIVDKGDWVSGKTYLFESWDANDKQYETHEVWYGGQKWRATNNNTNSVPSNTNTNWKLVLTKGADGTSIAIKGSVVAVASSVSGLPSSPSTYSLGLVTNSSTIYIYTGSWVSQGTASVGDGYILESNGHLYMWNGTRWNDCGQIKGDKGDAGNDGSSAFVIDLNDEMTAVSLNVDGETKTDFIKTVNIKAYYGTQNVTDRCSITESHTDSDIYVDLDEDTGIVVMTIHIYEGTALAQNNDITITCSNPTFGTRNAIFTIVGTKDGEQGEDGNDAVVYSLVPSVDEIIKKDDGTYFPSNAITCGVTKNVGGTQSTPDAYEYVLKQSIDGGAETLYNPTLPSAIHTSIAFILYVNNVMVDKETIPMLQDGVGIVSVTEYYAISSSKDTTPTTWSTDIPQMTQTNKYLWNKETILYTNGNSVTTSPIVIGMYGEKGVGIRSIAERYLITNLSSGVTKDTSRFDWHDTVVFPTAQKPYLYNYEIITYTDGSTSETDIALIGHFGKDGTNGTNGTNGVDGADAVAYQIIIDNASALVNASNYVSVDVICHVNKIEGASISTALNGTLYGRYKDNPRIAFTTSGQRWISGGSFNGQWDSEDIDNASELTLSYVVNNVTVATTTIPLTIQGAMGRNFYYKGDWIEKTDPDTFEVTDYETPFFRMQESSVSPYTYWVWVGENGVYDIDSDNRPSNTNSNWQIMTTDFQYLISNAIFSGFARLGSWIFNGEYMFSNAGKDEYGNSASYDDGALYYGEGDSRNTYTPNMVMNASTGQVYAYSITLEGVINNLIQVVTQANKEQYGEYISGELYLNPLKIGKYLKLSDDFTSSLDAYLPSAKADSQGRISIAGNLNLEELRQCVGKQIVFLSTIHNGIGWRLKSNTSVGTPYIVREKTYNFGTVITDDLEQMFDRVGYSFETYSEQVRAESQIIPSSGLVKTFVAECKLGNCNGYECIYWEISFEVNGLIQYD